MKLVTIKDLSEFLKVKESTLYSWVHSSYVPFYKLNGLLRFDMDEIEEWIKNSKQASYKPNAPVIRPKIQDIDSIIKKAIAVVKPREYNPSNGKPGQDQGLRKEE